LINATKTEIKLYKHYDTIVVGQGIAGTVLSYSLFNAGQDILVIDAPNPYSATKAAAGLINPITGRYYTKTWMIENLLSQAIKTYKELEILLSCKLWYPSDIYRVLHTITQVNDWESKVLKSGYQDYCQSISTLGKYQELTTHGEGVALIKQGGRVDINLLVSRYKQYLIDRSAYLETQFDHNELQVNSDCVVYGEYRARSIVFAEGVGALTNPYFQEIPLQPAKGQAVQIQVGGSAIKDQILKHKQYLVPIGESNTYWSGGGFKWNTENALPTSDFLDKYIEELNDFINPEYKILNHIAGIRPCVKDRKPLIGKHQTYRNIYIFNGMGTKGTSLSPYFAEMLVKYMLDSKPLLNEVDLARYY